MISNRRLLFASLWTFVSLNFIYADLVGLMDTHMLSQYLGGKVDGLRITPTFLTLAAAYMQIPLGNVFIPFVVKSDKALRWIQIIMGSQGVLVQGSTLFMGTPSPYYLFFSIIEIAVMMYILAHAVRWKVLSPAAPSTQGY